MKVDKALIRRRWKNAEWNYAIAAKESRVYTLLEANGGKYSGADLSRDEYELLCDDQPTDVLLTMLELTKNGEAK